MLLIGMLDSPYVRRVAVSLQLLGLPFEHRSLSVFRNFDEFREYNPVVKAPTLVCDDGTVLMDSTLILDYAECVAAPGRSLMPKDVGERMHALRIVGLVLAACEKSVQLVYERQLRPAEKQHEPWATRITGQLLAAYDALEREISQRPPATERDRIDQAGVSTAVAWQFTQQLLPGVIPPSRCPAITRFSFIAEALPEFAAAPHGAGTIRDPSDEMDAQTRH